MVKPKLNEVLAKLSNRQSFRVAFRYNNRVWVYKEYPSAEAVDLAMKGVLTDRQILDDEIVIESDLNIEAMNRSISKKICSILKKKNINHVQYHSGNKSYHVHLFLPGLKEYDYQQRTLLKKLFIRWVYSCGKDHRSCGQCDGIWGMDNNKPIRCALLKHKVDMQLCSKHLIRIEGAIHPETGWSKKLISMHTSGGNSIPQEVVEKYNRLTTTNVPQNRKVVLKAKSCVNLLLITPIHDCRERAAFALFCNLRNIHGADKAAMMLRAWNRDILNSYIDSTKIESIIHHHSEGTQAPGCNYIHELFVELGVQVNCQ